MTQQPPPLPKKKGMPPLVIILIVIGAIFVMAYIGSLLNEIPEMSAPPLVTMDEYQALQTNMSYQQVCTIIGSKGVEDARNHIEGTPGIMESIETVLYSWQNRDLSNMNATFQNNKLVAKAQFGLK